MTSDPVDGCPGELWVSEQRWGLSEVTWLLVKGVKAKTHQYPVDQEQR